MLCTWAWRGSTFLRRVLVHSTKLHHHHHHHHKHQGLDPLIRSVSRVTTFIANVSSVFQLFFLLVVCTDMISKGFGLVAFFASVKTSRTGPFDPFRLQSYNCYRQSFFVLPIVLLPCGLQWYDFSRIRFGGILCKCKNQFRLYSSTLSSMHSVCSSRRTESFVLWS